MTEICKCNGEKCKAKEKCYRFTSRPTTYQSWADFYTLEKDKKGRCGMFLEVRK